MFDNLPEDFLIEIIACLPVMALLRFMCVSKGWCCLITSPPFINQHLKNSTSNKNNDLLLLRNPMNWKGESWLTCPDDKDFPKSPVEEELDFPFKLRGDRDVTTNVVVGSCYHPHLRDYPKIYMFAL